MIIQLREIPAEGKTWKLNRKVSIELNEALRPVIGSQEYSAEMNITPLTSSGETYEVRGWIKTQLPEDCSRCGLEFNFELDEKFQNILMPALETPRDGKFAKPNHISDLHEEADDVVEYEGNSFNAGEFLHELVALAEPNIPAPKVDAHDNCSLCKISIKNHSFSYDSEKIEPVHPFAKLKGIKLN